MTNIEWTDATWNPVTGCTKVSAGCRNCYAETVADRFWGKQYGTVDGTVDGYRRRFTDVWTHPERLDEPLRWRKPRRVFVNSMSDLFHDAVRDEFIAAVFGVMAAAPQHSFQVLTKRPERMRRWFGWMERHCEGKTVIVGGALHYAQAHCQHGALRQTDPIFAQPWPLPNVWLGVSAENQETADERIPILLDTPAAVRFVSAEPLLGPIDFRYIRDGDEPFNAFRPRGMREPCDTLGLDWIIVGGESGPAARPCDVAWIRGIVEQCRDAGVPVFVKQLGTRAAISRPIVSCGLPMRDVFQRGCGFWPTDSTSDEDLIVRMTDRKGGDPAEWPEDLRVREFPA